MKARNERLGSTGRRGWAALVLGVCAAMRAGAAGACRTTLAVPAVTRLAVLGLLLQPVAVWAVTRTWDGSDSTAWGTTANWVEGAVPTSADTADFNLKGPYSDSVAPFNPNASAYQYDILGITIGGVNANMVITSGSSNAPRVRGGGISIASGAGTTTIGLLKIRDNQSWINNSSSLLTVAGTANQNNGPYTLTIAGTGTGGTTITGPVINNGSGNTLISLTVNASNSITTFSAANTYTGQTSIDGGTLLLSGSGAIASGSFISFNGGVLAGTGTFGSSGSARFGGARALNTSGAGNVTLAGASGGGFAAAGGTLDVALGAATWNSTTAFYVTGAPMILGSTAADNVVTWRNDIALNGAVREIKVLDNTGSAADKAVIEGILSGDATSGVNKTGAGVLEFKSGVTHTYGGTTTISDGTLLVNGTLDTQTSAVTVGGGTATGTPTLGGTGTINRPVTIAATGGGAAGTLAPGTDGTVNELKVNGDVTFESGSTFKVDVSGATADKLTVVGAVTLTSLPTLTIVEGGELTLSSYTLLTATSISGTFTATVPEGYIIEYTPTEAPTTVILKEEGSTDVYLQFSSATYSKAEGNDDRDTVTVTVTVTRTGPTTEEVTVKYATSAGTATAGDDYTEASGTLTFEIGQSSQTFPVTIIGDTTSERDETVNLTLSNPSATAILGEPQTAVLTIENDDKGVLSFSSATYNQAEGRYSTVNKTITVTRTGKYGAVTVNYATSDGTAKTADNDYTAASGSFNWVDQDETVREFTVPIKGDTRDEEDETVVLTLSNQSSGATIGTGIATLTILDAGPVTTFLDKNAVPLGSITASQSDGWVDGSGAAVVVDWSGITGTYPNGTDSGGAAGTFAHSESTLPGNLWLSFDFGSVLKLDGMHYWNGNQFNYAARGIQSMDIQTSTDGSIWTTVDGQAGVIMTMAPTPGGSTTYAGDDYDWPGTISSRYMRFKVNSNWGGTGTGYTTFSEVVFYTSPTGTVFMFR